MSKLELIYQAFHTLKQKNPEIFLDYDGTLVGLRMNPEECYADEELKEILRGLDDRYRTYIVTGRSLDDIENFIDMDFNVIALHGAMIKRKDSELVTVDHFARYVEICDSIYEKRSHYTEEFPGLRVYNKHGGVLFHLGLIYDNLIKLKLKEYVHELAKLNGMEVYEGKSIIEMRIPNINKGLAIKSIRRSGGALIAGDDKTDEESFKHNMDALKIKVGSGETIADFRVESYVELREILKNL